MKSFIADYNSRVEEFDVYFSFVEFIDKVETHKKQMIKCDNIPSYIPKRDLQKILRSNCFLLLYNLVESSIRNSIVSVYDCIHDKALKYENLSERIKEIWLTNQTKRIKLSEKNAKNYIKKLMEEISAKNQIVLEKDTIDISGNLDYENIQKIINLYGFFGQITLDKSDLEKSLNKIKTERNLLAHGNKTFCQSGEIITIAELTNIKETIICFLKELLDNVATYIDNEKYKK